MTLNPIVLILVMMYGICASITPTQATSIPALAITLVPTELLKQVSPSVEDPRHPGEREHPGLCPLFLGRVPRVVDEDVPAARLDLLLVGRGGGLPHTVQQMEEHLEKKETRTELTLITMTKAIGEMQI